jgi:hypothetical protein
MTSLHTRPVAHSGIKRRTDDGYVKQLGRSRQALGVLQVGKGANAGEAPLEAIG